jgi:predicted RNase H-like HicB family nuclease
MFGRKKRVLPSVDVAHTEGGWRASLEGEFLSCRGETPREAVDALLRDVKFDAYRTRTEATEIEIREHRPSSDGKRIDVQSRFQKLSATETIPAQLTVHFVLKQHGKEWSGYVAEFPQVVAKASSRAELLVACQRALDARMQERFENRSGLPPLQPRTPQRTRK